MGNEGKSNDFNGNDASAAVVIAPIAGRGNGGTIRRRKLDKQTVEALRGGSSNGGAGTPHGGGGGETAGKLPTRSATIGGGTEEGGTGVSVGTRSEHGATVRGGSRASGASGEDGSNTLTADRGSGGASAAGAATADTASAGAATADTASASQHEPPKINLGRAEVAGQEEIASSGAKRGGRGNTASKQPASLPEPPSAVPAGVEPFVLLLMEEGVNLLVRYRGEHWKQPREALKPIAHNYALFIAEHMPNIAREMDKNAPLTAAITQTIALFGPIALAEYQYLREMRKKENANPTT